MTIEEFEAGYQLGLKNRPLPENVSDAFRHGHETGREVRVKSALIESDYNRSVDASAPKLPFWSHQ